LPKTPVITIKDTELVAEGFKKMILEKVSGVGVVDSENKLVGCLSATDIRGISHHGDLLEHILLDYHKYRETMADLKIPIKTDIIKATANATLQSVIDTVISERVHRVFITEGNHLTGVISLTDILKCISEQSFDEHKLE